jgi:homoserine acetyltransferase
MLLSRCSDLMDLGRGFDNYSDGVKRIKAKTLLVGFEKDMLIPGLLILF